GSQEVGKLSVPSFSSCCCPKAPPVSSAMMRPAAQSVRPDCLFIVLLPLFVGRNRFIAPAAFQHLPCLWLVRIGAIMRFLPTLPGAAVGRNHFIAPFPPRRIHRSRRSRPPSPPETAPAATSR